MTDIIVAKVAGLLDTDEDLVGVLPRRDLEAMADERREWLDHWKSPEHWERITGADPIWIASFVLHQRIPVRYDQHGTPLIYGADLYQKACEIHALHESTGGVVRAGDSR